MIINFRISAKTANKRKAVDVTGDKIDYMVEDKLEAYTNAKVPPSSDVLATYETEYSVYDEAGEKHSAKRTVHIGKEPG